MATLGAGASGTAGAVGAGTDTASGSLSAPVTADEFAFGTVVNAVEDLGADPTGEEPVDPVIQQALWGSDGGLKVVFPAGEYRWTDHTYVGIDADFGFVAESGADVRIVGDAGLDDWIVHANVRRFLFRGIDVDITGDGTMLGLHPKTELGFRVEDVEWHGRAPEGAATGALSVYATDPDVTSLVRGAEFRRGNWAVEGYGFCWVDDDNKGTVRFVDCAVEECSDNAIYASASEGPVQVIDSEFWNNNVSSVRLHGDGCLVRNCTVGVDLDRYTGSREGEGYYFNTRAFRVESKGDGVNNPGYLVIEDTDVLMDDVVESRGGIVFNSISGGAKVRNCRIESNTDGVPPVFAQAPGETGGHDLVDGPYDVQIRDCEITGTTTAPAVRIEGRPDSVVENTCIDTEGPAFEGEFTTRDVATEGCASPLPNRLAVTSTDGATDYRIRTSGSVTDGRRANAGDDAESGLVTGTVWESGTDDYRFAGTVESVTVPDGDREDLSVTVDGRPLYDQTLAVTGNADGVEYEIEVSGGITTGDRAEWSDMADGDTARGTVWTDGVDSYRFAGEVETVTVTDGRPGDVSVTVDGEPYPHRTLRVESLGDRAEYRAEVSGTAEPGDRANAGDTVSDGTIAGVVNGGTDTFRFAGGLESVTVTDGDAASVRVAVDGQSRPFRRLRLAADTGLEYRVEVSGAIEPGAEANPGDATDGSVATGALDGWYDTYRFSGAVEDVDVAGGTLADLDVFVDGNDRFDRRLVVESVGDQDWVRYLATVSGEVRPAEYVDDADQTDDNGYVQGSVINGGRDVYEFFGDLEWVSVRSGDRADLAVSVEDDR